MRTYVYGAPVLDVKIISDFEPPIIDSKVLNSPYSFTIFCFLSDWLLTLACLSDNLAKWWGDTWCLKFFVIKNVKRRQITNYYIKQIILVSFYLLLFYLKEASKSKVYISFVPFYYSLIPFPLFLQSEVWNLVTFQLPPLISI